MQLMIMNVLKYMVSPKIHPLSTGLNIFYWKLIKKTCIIKKTVLKPKWYTFGIICVKAIEHLGRNLLTKNGVLASQLHITRCLTMKINYCVDPNWIKRNIYQNLGRKKINPYRGFCDTISYLPDPSARAGYDTRSIF